MHEVRHLRALGGEVIGVFLLAYAGCIGPRLRIDNAPMRKYITMAIHYAIAIAIVLHVVSCVFIGESHMPGLQF